MARRTVTLTAMTALLLGLGLGPGHAEDGWNPWRDADEKRGRRPRGDTTQPAPPALPPMDGVNSRPWAQPATPQNAFPGAEAPGSADGNLSSAPLPWGPSGPSASPSPLPRAASPGMSPDKIERTELKPVTAGEAAAGDTPALPSGFWQGLDTRQAQELIGALQLPPRSSAINTLWRRLWTGEAVGEAAATPGGTGAASISHAAMRIEALYRSGLVDDLAAALQQREPAAGDMVAGVLAARSRIAVGDGQAGCAASKALQRNLAQIPKPLRPDAMLVSAWCAASGQNAAAAAELAAGLLRAEQVAAPVALAVLDALATGSTGQLKLPPGSKPTLLDFRFLELAQADHAPSLIPQAEPALLASLAKSAANPPTRILAAEAAIGLNAITPAQLAEAYRSASFDPEALAEPQSRKLEPPLRRALLLAAFEAERNPQKKTRLARSLLDDVRRTGNYMATAAMLGPAAGSLFPAPEIGWFAETATEISLAAGRYDTARLWAEPPPQGERFSPLRHWLVLADIADPNWRGRRGEHLEAIESFAVRGRLGPELMHRLVTVLDALDYQIPIPLWEAASRTPQPKSGHLPETGILSQLQDAAKKKEHARTVLLAMRALGPDSAHMIALGDVIRALRRAGLEADARRVGLEALFGGWPRQASN